MQMNLQMPVQPAQLIQTQSAQPAQASATQQSAQDFHKVMEQVVNTSANTQTDKAQNPTDTPAAQDANTAAAQDFDETDLEAAAKLVKRLAEESDPQALAQLLEMISQNDEMAQQLLSKLQEMLDKEGNQRGMEMLSELFGITPQIFDAWQTMPDGDQEMAQTVVDGLQKMLNEMQADSGNILGAAQQTPVTADVAQTIVQAAATQTVVEQANPQTTPQNTTANVEQTPVQEQMAAPQTQEAQQSTANQQQSDMKSLPQDVQVTQATQDAPDNDAKILWGQSQFQQAVQTVQKQLKTQDSTDENTQLNLDELQQSVNGAAFMRNTAHPLFQASRTETATIQPYATPAEIADQLKTGAQQALRLGDSEFVMQLKPEGLGNLTIRLVEIGAKMTLSITAANEATQRLLTAQLPELQQAMKPLQVEVLPVQGQQESQGAQGELFMHNGAAQQQDFSEHQHDGAQQSAYTGNDQDGQEPPEIFAETQEMHYASEGLDTYI